MADLEEKTSRPVHVEDKDVESVFGADSPAKDGNTTSVMGTVKLTEGTIIYIPAPTADPRDPGAAHGLLITRAIEAVHRSLETGGVQPITS